MFKGFGYDDFFGFMSQVLKGVDDCEIHLTLDSVSKVSFSALLDFHCFDDVIACIDVYEDGCYVEMSDLTEELGYSELLKSGQEVIDFINTVLHKVDRNYKDGKWYSDLCVRENTLCV